MKFRNQNHPDLSIQHRVVTPANSRGFALIATISVMILLVMIALAMLSLSTVEIHNSQGGSHREIARANARMGLMLALGELQKSIGPDQRITATSELLAASGSTVKNARLTGVWEARNDVLGNTPDYDRSTAFRRWLVSNSNIAALEGMDFATTGTFEDDVVMVGDYSVAGETIPEVKAGRVHLTRGNCAWWVGDENCKGYSQPTDLLARSGATPSLADRLASAATPGAYGMIAIDQNYPANDSEGDKVVSHGEFELASSVGKDAGAWYHDVSPYARGVLSNVTKGGLRKDLSLYLEMPRTNDPWPNIGGPSSIGPNGKYALSPVDEYDVLAWKRLHNFYHLKETVVLSGDRPALVSYKDGTSGMHWNSGVLRPAPVLTRLVIFVAFGSIKDPDDPTKYVLRFYAYPVMTLWNPYNVDLAVSADSMNGLFTSFPMQHRLFVETGGRFAFKETYRWNQRLGGNNSAGAGINPILRDLLVLKAGEAKMLSSLPGGVRWNSERPFHQEHDMVDQPFVYSPGSPGGMWGVGGAHDPEITETKGVGTDVVKIITELQYWDSGGRAFRDDYPSTWDIRTGQSNSAHGPHNGSYQWSSKIGWRFESQGKTPVVARPDTNLDSGINAPEATFADVFNAPRPFMVVDARLKPLDDDVLPNKTWRDTIPSHPFQGVTQNQTSNDATAYFAQAYRLNFDSINSYHEASQYLQVAPTAPTHTYFGGSYFPAEGQSFITDREIPLTPLTSIAQLQHVPQHSVDNLYSSGLFFQNRAIGNSYASPGVPADKVKDTGIPFSLDMWANLEAGTIDKKTYAGDYFFSRPNIDRSYAANHLLWDDYFFSSLAAKNSRFRPSGERVSLADVVRDFYEQTRVIPNSRYRPYLTDSADDVIDSLMSGSNPDAEAYQKVASHLMVDGMFNVNSTSEKAWKIMLASAHKKKMVIMEDDSKPKLDKEASYVVSRFNMPNGSSADIGNGQSIEQLKWRGYRELSETQIQELAEAMVRQVKERGPFRSLAEFVNRRLASENDDKSKYGALQAALEDTDVSINEEYRAKTITAADISAANYANKTAALGSRYQGSPAYVNQADILNAIGPVLSVRSDTFIVRGYGESLDAKGEVVSSSWCEAVVQRTPDYIDSVDEPETAEADLSSDLNRNFGRKLRTVSFRWLSPEEI